MVYTVYNIFYDSKVNLSELFNTLGYILENKIIEKLYEYIKDKKSDTHIVFIDVNDFRSRYLGNITEVEFNRILQALIYTGILGYASNQYYVIIPVIEKYI